MYGIVNKAIEDLVKENFGEAAWVDVLKISGIEVEFFIGSESYDDTVTYKIAQATADVTGLSLDQVLVAFGEWWVLRTSKERYGGMMQAGGASLREFLVNLPVFHNRVMLVYPKLTPPEFKVTDISDAGLCLHYYSKREGLREFVRGLLQGLAKLFNTQVSIDLIQKDDKTQNHEVFRISW